MLAPVRHFLRCFEDLHDAGSSNATLAARRRERLAEHVARFVRAGEPIELLLPGFAFKNPNRRKTLGALPDLAEHLALRRLADFAAELGAGYPPGGRVIVFSDGRVWGDLLGVEPAEQRDYAAALRAIEGLAPQLVFASLGPHLELLPGEGSVTARLRQLSASGPGRAALERQLGLDGGPIEDHDRHRVYTRFITLCEQDRPFPPTLDAASRRARCENAALEMMLRHAAFGRVLAAAYPRAIRLSVHAGNRSGDKYAVRLFADEPAGVLPYHGCAVLDAHGQRPRIMSVAAAERLPGGVELVRTDAQHPWCLRRLAHAPGR